MDSAGLMIKDVASTLQMVWSQVDYNAVSTAAERRVSGDG